MKLRFLDKFENTWSRSAVKIQSDFTTAKHLHIYKKQNCQNFRKKKKLNPPIPFIILQRNFASQFTKLIHIAEQHEKI
jgi:hypothetical protein